MIRPVASIRAKITLGIVALLVIMTIVTTAVAMERSEDALRNQITLTHEARANVAAQEVDQTLDRAKTIVRATALENEMRKPVREADLANGTVPPGGLPVKRLMLEHAHNTDPVFEGALVTDTSGRVLMGEPYDLQQDTAATGQNPYSGESLRRVAEFTTQVPAPVVHAGGAEETWTISVRLITTDGNVWGVLVLVASTEALGELIGAADADDSFFVILDRTGTVLIGPPGFPPGTDLSDQHDTLQAADRSSGLVAHDGQEYLATLTPLGDDWRLIVAQESGVAFAPVDAMLSTILIVAGLVIVVGVATGLFVAGRITAPVTRLKEAAERVAAGKYGTQVRTTSRDELADLATAFNLMSARLLEEHERLKRHQKTLESTVQERTGELAEKNEELEAFVYATSHDLRTPLITLDWLLEELHTALDNDDEGLVKDTLRRMRMNVDGMDRLIADLLELSRIGRTEGRPQGVMLRPVVEASLERLDHPRNKRGTTVHIDFDDFVIVEADPRRMEQVFDNLLSNAIKYGVEGGHVHVRASPIGEAHQPWKWRIEVSDDGPGVPSEDREHVFQLFRRGPRIEDEDVDGTGVGLALVRKIIRAYGGEIKAAKANEGGALFWFTLNATRPGQTPGPDTDVGEDETERSPAGIEPAQTDRKTPPPIPPSILDPPRGARSTSGNG